MVMPVMVQEHPLKAEIKKLKLQLWKIRRALGGSPSETYISRALNGIDPMTEELESKIREIISEYKRPLVIVK
jgi:hypothetical protein